ncbi:hypothetical protein MTR67_048076 [Solanum verrucosum]|uniref:Reverse transcriptase domain-containing protein n=1 Tax=Solanum verrucosum TaxID=315347 RepID=A0AAF0ZX11_SOLVR|nr:hypothetical protein MTR67_048076 [Solanum verrucosum]
MGIQGKIKSPELRNIKIKPLSLCPYGTFASKLIPFGLCNAPVTFQRFMMSIFPDMEKETIEVFMDDFSMVGDSFDRCLMHLTEGIVLGHQISQKGVEVARVKIEVIEKLPPPRSMFSWACRRARVPRDEKKNMIVIPTSSTNIWHIEDEY